MRKQRIKRWLAAGMQATTLLWAGAAGSAELVVIVSARSPLAALKQDQVADIFLGQVAALPEAGEIKALDQQIGSRERDEFYLKVAAKTPPLLKAYWSKMIFTGRGHPPRQVPGNLAVRKLVAENPALIGYIDRSALDASVKPVLVLR
jgi:ABC-type phosphate transport system substrate-binding protein